MECINYIGISEITRGSNLFGGWESVASVRDISSGEEVGSFGSIYCNRSNVINYDYSDRAVKTTDAIDGVSFTPSFVYPFFVDGNRRCWAFVEKQGILLPKDNGIAVYGMDGTVSRYLRFKIGGKHRSLLPFITYVGNGNIYIFFLSYEGGENGVTILKVSADNVEIMAAATSKAEIGFLEEHTPSVTQNSVINADLQEDGVAKFLIEEGVERLFRNRKYEVEI